jgi:hypothetical protein
MPDYTINTYKSGIRTIPLYTPEAMVDLMVNKPDYNHDDFANHFGRNASWMSSVLASDKFQQVMELRKHEIADPSLTATMEERFRALALRSVVVLQEKLNEGDVSDIVVIKAAELGIKALGMGQNVAAPAVISIGSSSESVAEKLLAAMDRRDVARTIDIKVQEVDGK